jgi:hypothetical protein
MLKIHKQNKELILEYSSHYPNANWVYKRIEDDGFVDLIKTFRFEEKDLLNSPVSLKEDEEIYEAQFLLGKLSGDFYTITKKTLTIAHDLQIYKDINITDKLFIKRGLSIMSKINSLIQEPIIIGGELDNSIPLNDFVNIINNFPTQTEMMHYENSRITRVLIDYFQTASNAQEKLEKYLQKKKTIKQPISTSFLQEYEYQKYQYLHSMLTEMLATKGYLEKDWQNKILEIILLLYPQYIKALSNVNIKDYYSKPNKTTNRYIDIMLVNASGYIDIIEIKQPFENSIFSLKEYRNNNTPHKELSGAIMQVEKYLFHLNKWGYKGEKHLNEKYAQNLPKHLNLQVANPKGLIILGRSKNFTHQQKLDFEIIKKKYANIIDIITYDDLLQRLQSSLDSLKK